MGAAVIQDKPRRRWIIAASFVVAFMLTAMPLPDWALVGRPFWVALVLIYWCMALPRVVGIGSAWFIGLLVDVLTGALLGQHAASLSVVAFLTLSMHQRIRVFPLGQQALAVGSILSVHLVILTGVRVLTGNTPLEFGVLYPLASSMLLWPWLFIILRDLRRRFAIS